VTARSGSASALIVDQDVAFVLWLGEVFSELGCHAVPALNCRQALARMRQLHLPVEMLVINPELQGAERVVRRILALNAGVRIVLICNAVHRRRGEPVARAAASWDMPVRSTLRRPLPGERICRQEWIGRVRSMLSTEASANP
jgi:two-component SAPR family response regulator